MHVTYNAVIPISPTHVSLYKFPYLTHLGAVGSCPLAFILPALFHYKLARHSTSPYTILKDMLIIVIGAVTGVIGFIVVTTEIFHRL